MRKGIDMTGQIIGQLTVIGLSSFKKRNCRTWECLCSCGKKCNYEAGTLRSGHISSCGCKNKKYLHSPKITHGMSQTRFYKIWKGIIYRCTRPKTNIYKYYGARGITVSNSWLKFENFMEDMYPSYLAHELNNGTKNTTIDRKDNNGNYCLENCHWVTWKEQSHNRRLPSY